MQIETEAEVAHSAIVAAEAAESLDGAATAEQLLSDSSVSVTPNSQVLVVTFEADTAELARDGSQAMAEAYLTLRSEDAEEAVAAARKTR